MFPAKLVIRLLPLALLAAGALLSLPPYDTATAQAPDIATLIDRVDQQRLHDHVAAIAEPRNAFAQPDALQRAADYIQSQFQSFGYAVTLDPVQSGGATFPNIIAVHQGTTCPERVFIVGGHYDSVPPAPGADDNASSVAATLELARILADTPLPATVWFTAFSFEEDGLLGSRQLAQEAVQNGTQVIGMVSLEMLAYTTRDADWLAVVGNDASVRLTDSFRRASQQYVPDLTTAIASVRGNGEDIPDTRRSDHSSFWDAGFQAMIVSDTGPLRNPNYHQPTDTIDTLDFPWSAKVTKAMLATTVDYVTYDGDANGQPDVCSGPLAATATPTPLITAPPFPFVTATRTAAPSLPPSGTGGRAAPQALGALALIGGAGLMAAAWLVLRRVRSRAETS